MSQKSSFQQSAQFVSKALTPDTGGSDRAADRWREDYQIDGVDDIGLHHLYRAMAWLGEALAEDQQNGATPFAPRCQKDVLEEELFARGEISSARSILCFLIRQVFISKAQAATPSDNAAFPRIIDQISTR